MKLSYCNRQHQHVTNLCVGSCGRQRAGDPGGQQDGPGAERAAARESGGGADARQQVRLQVRRDVGRAPQARRRRLPHPHQGDQEAACEFELVEGITQLRPFPMTST